MSRLLSLLFIGAIVAAADGPNVVLILADDLGWADLGCYGQKRVKTPALDRLAGEGVRCTAAYSGSTVCAPSRCTLLTGLHTGHARVRGNGKTSLAAADVTLAEVLMPAGYASTVIGKWGLGMPDDSGSPMRQGFAAFYGYFGHGHAHNHWPDHLWRGETRVDLPNVLAKPSADGRGVAEKKVVYANDRLTDEALATIAAAKTPFLLFFAPTIPHANNEAGNQGMEVPDDAPYTAEPWPQAQRNKAAMISRLDASVGRLMAALAARGLDQDTLVLFTSDNGPHREGGSDPEFLDSNGPLRGIKRDLYEGGIRVPLIARWPGRIPAGTTFDRALPNWDLLPTIAAAAGVEPPAGIDGRSRLGEWRGAAAPEDSRAHYWEFHEGGFHQAVRQGRWKAVRHGLDAAIELYDLAADLGEATDVASTHADVVAAMAMAMAAQRTASPDWPIKAAR